MSDFAPFDDVVGKLLDLLPGVERSADMLRDLGATEAEIEHEMARQFVDRRCGSVKPSPNFTASPSTATWLVRNCTSCELSIGCHPIPTDEPEVAKLQCPRGTG
jgi:hypothetical protein